MLAVGRAQETWTATSTTHSLMPRDGSMRAAGDTPYYWNISYAGPLRTLFSPLPSCSEILLYEISALPPDSQTIAFIYAGGYDTSVGATVRDKCLPSKFNEGHMLGSMPVFSPGRICPVGYGPSCTIVAPGATIAAATTVQIWDKLPIEETAIGCCPR